MDGGRLVEKERRRHKEGVIYSRIEISLDPFHSTSEQRVERSTTADFTSEGRDRYE